MILTQADGIIMGPISKLLGVIFNAIYNLFFNYGVESIALSIVVFTIFVRLLIFPLNLRMTRSSKIQQYLRPEFNKINKKYKGKKDTDSMLAQQKETRELQEKYGIKMTAGCLTSLIQLPIFMGLYNVIQNVPAYVTKIKDLYEPIALQIMGAEDGYSILSQFKTDNSIQRVTSTLAEFTTSTDPTSTEGITALNSIIDILNRCTSSMFDSLAEVFSATPAVGEEIAKYSSDILRTNQFILGINLSEAPGFKWSAALIIPIVSFVCQFLSMMVVPKTETGDPQQDAQAEQMRKSMYFMPFMSLFITINAPAGLGIYWATSAFISFLITFFSNLYYDHADMEKILQKQMEKAENKRQKNGGKTKESFMEKLQNAATEQQAQANGTSTTTSSGKAETRVGKYGSMGLKSYVPEYDSEKAGGENTDSSSISYRADAVRRFNEEGAKK